jgi:hypothetical protein
LLDLPQLQFVARYTQQAGPKANLKLLLLLHLLPSNACTALAHGTLVQLLLCVVTRHPEPGQLAADSFIL